MRPRAVTMEDLMSARQRILKRITEERRGAASTRSGSIDARERVAGVSRSLTT